MAEICFRIEVVLQPAQGSLRMLPRNSYRRWAAWALQLRLQVLLASVFLLERNKPLEWELKPDGSVQYHGNVRDQLSVEDEGIIPSFCRDVGKRLQAVGYKFYKIQNEERRLAAQIDFVLPSGQRFSYPRDAAKGETFDY